MMNYELCWECTKEKGARLLRMYGATPEAVLPEHIGGYPLTEIGAYCFAQEARLPERYERTRVSVADTFGTGTYSTVDLCASRSEGAGNEQEEEGELTALAGRYVERIVLPDSVVRIGNLAFYHCMSLRELVLSGGDVEIGGDAFMNCSKLTHLTLRAGCKERSSLRQLLAQISSDMEVTFEGRDGAEARILFPEYYESYDEIAPAHLFGRNIEGEGFRARQCFRDGVMDFKQYDTIFPKACAEESERTLCALALDRLRYPVELGEAERERYEAYVRAHMAYISGQAVKTRDLPLVEYLCAERLMDAEGLDQCIASAAGADWAEGAAGLLRLKQRYVTAQRSEDRYAFDDF